MTEDKPKGAGAEPLADMKLRNPFIENFCRALVVRFEGEEVSGEVVEKSTDKVYELFQYILGRRMVEALPEEKREAYLELTQDLGDLTYERISEIFDEEDLDIEGIMKETMMEVTRLYKENI